MNRFPSLFPTLCLALVGGATAGALRPRATASADVWQPTVGATWDILLSSPLAIDDSSPSLGLDVDIIDFDLYDNTDDGNDSSKIEALHGAGKKVICYFSAGSFEPGRKDSGQFTAADKGSGLDGWPGEYWLDLTSDNVASIMRNRIAVAAKMGCDAIDPDNMDAYNNDGGGLGMTEQNSIDFFTKVLAPAARKYSMAIGLKNAGDIILDVIDDVQFSVNEQCSQYSECADYTAFIEAGKPVFHIEYPGDDGYDLPVADTSSWCKTDGQGTNIAKFSTVIKTMDLDGWVEFCNGDVQESTT